MRGREAWDGADDMQGGAKEANCKDSANSPAGQRRARFATH